MTNSETALPPERLDRVRWVGALLVRDPSTNAVLVCGEAQGGLDPGWCAGPLGWPVDIVAGADEVTWKSVPESGTQAKIDLEAVVNEADKPPVYRFTDAVVTPYAGPQPPLSYVCPARLKTGSLTADTYTKISEADVQIAANSRRLGARRNGNNVELDVLSLDRHGFETYCSMVDTSVQLTLTVAFRPI